MYTIGQRLPIEQVVFVSSLVVFVSSLVAKRTTEHRTNGIGYEPILKSSVTGFVSQVKAPRGGTILDPGPRVSTVPHLHVSPDHLISHLSLRQLFHCTWYTPRAQHVKGERAGFQTSTTQASTTSSFPTIRNRSSQDRCWPSTTTVPTHYTSQAVFDRMSLRNLSAAFRVHNLNGTATLR